MRALRELAGVIVAGFAAFFGGIALVVGLRVALALRLGERILPDGRDVCGRDVLVHG